MEKENNGQESTEDPEEGDPTDDNSVENEAKEGDSGNETDEADEPTLKLKASDDFQLYEALNLLKGLHIFAYICTISQSIRLIC